MDKILKERDIDDLEKHVNSFKLDVDNALEACTTVIKSFSNMAVVESFFASGKYGQSEKEEMEKIYNAIQKYSDVINADDGLIAQTKSYIETQRSLVQSGSSGGSTSGYYGGN